MNIGKCLINKHIHACLCMLATLSRSSWKEKNWRPPDITAFMISASALTLLMQRTSYNGRCRETPPSYHTFSCTEQVVSSVLACFHMLFPHAMHPRTSYHCLELVCRETQSCRRAQALKSTCSMGKIDSLNKV